MALKIDKLVLARIIQGVLADPGFPSREAKKVVSRALEIYDAMESLVAEVSSDVTTKVAEVTRPPVATSKVTATKESEK